MYQRIPRCIVAAVGILAISSASQAQETINFISGGTAAKKILIISNTASGTTSAIYKDWENLRNAQIDLANTLTEITGQTFTTGTFTGSSGGMAGGAVIIGRASDLNLSGTLSTTNLRDNERFIIATANSGSNLIIAGVTNNGAVDGVYDLLEQLGCEWYYLNPKWTKLPSDANLSWTSPATMVGGTASATIGGVSQALHIYQVEQPDYVARWIVPLLYGATGGNFPHKEWLEQWDQFLAWSRRNRNVKGVFINDNHNYAAIVEWAKSQTQAPNDPVNGKWNPDFYACISGSRVADPSAPALQQTKYYQLCAGNPDVLQLCKDYADWYFSKTGNEMQMSVSMEPQDDTLFCDVTCTWCSNTAYLPTGHNHTDKTLRIANAVAEHMETAWPGKYVGILAYSSHANVPTALDAHDNIFVSVATGYLFFGKTPEQLLAEWYPLTPNLGIYDYLSNFTWDMGMPNRSEGSDLHYIATDIPAWHDLHVGNYVAQSSLSDAILGLGHYLAMKKLWDTDADLTAIRNEFITSMFGDAAGPMDEFYKRIDKGNHYNLSEDLIGRLFRYLDAAFVANSSGSNDPKVESRLDDLALWLRHCELRRAWEKTSGSNKVTRTNSASAALVHAWKMRSTTMVDSLSLGSIKTVWSDSYPGAAYEDAFAWPLNTGTFHVVSGTQGTYYALQPNTYEKNWDVPMVALSASTRVTQITTTGTYPNITPTGTYPLTWVRLHPESHPWKPSGTYSHSDILTIVSNGTANNALLPAEPRSFGTDMVMSPFAPVPTASGTHRGNHVGNPRGLTAYYMFTDSNGDTPPITITAGKVGNLDKGDLAYTLCSADGVTEISTGTIVNTAPSGPLITETLVFTNSQFGLAPNTPYLLKSDDRGSYSSGTWAYSANISVAMSSEYPYFRSGAPNHRYFYVPKNTTHVLISSAAGFGGGYTYTGTVITGTVGTAIYWPSATNMTGTVWGGGTNIYSPVAGTVAIPVPAGTDDRIWDARSMTGTDLMFLNVPGLMAPTPQQLLIPKDAISHMVSSGGTSGTARGGADDIMISATHTYQIYTSSANLPNVTVTSYGVYPDSDDTWTLYSDSGTAVGSVVIATGTVPIGTTAAALFASVGTVSASNSYRLVYENNNVSGAELVWPAGQQVCVEASEESPYSIELGNGGTRFFFVPKGTVSVDYEADSIPSGFSVYKAVGSVLKYTQAASGSPVSVSIPVSGDDNQFWKMGSAFTGIKFRFKTIPGHVGLRPDEVLIPRWAKWY